jgi:hypothetical protein
LLLLVANDFVFKQQFHNGFTGKLSDVAGLFVFSLFWISFFPRRKTFICISTALLFVFWKSAYSQALIDGWNRLPFFGIQRTVDYSDLWALLIVPAAYFYRDSFTRIQLPRRLIYPLAIVSVVAFTATSYSHKATFNNQYQFQWSKKQLLERMSRLPKEDVSDAFWEGTAFSVNFDACNRASIGVEDGGLQTVITLKEMEHRCPSKPSDDEMREYFEKQFIDKLREEPVRRSEQISYIWASSPGRVSNKSSP